MLSDIASSPEEIGDTPEAPADIRRLYDDIRAVTGVSFVNQLYRRLAATPGLLNAVWETLRPAIIRGDVDALALDVLEAVGREVDVIPARPAEGVGSAVEAGGAIALTRAYLRNNARNLIAFQSLFAAGAVDGSVREPARRVAALNAEAIPLPPLPPAGALPAEVEERLARLDCLGEAGAPTHRASFWRHLAHWPELLAGFDRRLADLSRTVDLPAFTQAAQAHGREAAKRLRIRPLPPDARETTARLVGGLVGMTIPKMIPLGTIVFRDLCRSIEEDPTA